MAKIKLHEMKTLMLLSVSGLNPHLLAEISYHGNKDGAKLINEFF